MAAELAAIGGIFTWACWAAVGWQAWAALPWTDDRSGSDRGGTMVACIFAAPLIATFFVAQWAITAASPEGRHRRKMERMRRVRELMAERRRREREFDRLLEAS